MHSLYEISPQNDKGNNIQTQDGGGENSGYDDG